MYIFCETKIYKTLVYDFLLEVKILDDNHLNLLFVLYKIQSIDGFGNFKSIFLQY